MRQRMGKIQYSGRGVALACAALALTMAFVLSGQEGNGFYRLAQRNGAEVVVSPSGVPEKLAALNHVHLVSASAPQPDLSPAYVDQRSQAIIAALRADGFNALGGDTDADIWHRGLPFLEDLDVSGHLQADQQTPAVDVYADTFAPEVASLVSSACAPRAADPDLVGYISDEKLTWDPGENPTAVLAFYLSLPISARGRLRAIDFLRERYHSQIAALNRAWGVKVKDFIYIAPPPRATPAYTADGAAFAAPVVARYLQVTANAVRAADGHHLFFGAGLVPSPATPAEIWKISDLALVRAPLSAAASALASQVAALTSGAVVVSVSGCDNPSPLATLNSTTSVAGVIWNPDTDWQSGRCAAAARQWRTLNPQHPAPAQTSFDAATIKPSPPD
jgi:hypothetical protein